jgi:hypothetical protein
MLKKSISYFALIIAIILLPQTSIADVLPSGGPMVTKGISLSYWGTVADNSGHHLDLGLKQSLERYYIQNKRFTILGSASLVLQRRPGVYTSVGLLFGQNTRWTSKPGVFFEHGITFGYLGSYYDFDIYKVNSKGEIVNIGREWASSIIVGYLAGLGYDFSILTKLKLQLFIRPNIYLRFPNHDNVAYLHNFNFESGIIIHPKWLKSPPN